MKKCIKCKKIKELFQFNLCENCIIELGKNNKSFKRLCNMMYGKFNKNKNKNKNKRDDKMSNKLKLINKEKLVNEIMSKLLQKLYIKQSYVSYPLNAFLLEVIEKHKITDKIVQIKSNKFGNREFWYNNLNKINKRDD